MFTRDVLLSKCSQAIFCVSFHAKTWKRYIKTTSNLIFIFSKVHLVEIPAFIVRLVNISMEDSNSTKAGQPTHSQHKSVCLWCLRPTAYNYGQFLFNLKAQPVRRFDPVQKLKFLYINEVNAKEIQPCYSCSLFSIYTNSFSFPQSFIFHTCLWFNPGIFAFV